MSLAYENRTYYINYKFGKYSKQELIDLGHEPIVHRSMSDGICLPTALHLAMFKGDERMISMLIKHGASYDGNYKRTPIDIAEMNNDHKTALFYYEEMKNYLDSQNTGPALTGK